MPWKREWFDNELYMEYNGVKVYHAYKGDEHSDPFTFWFCLDPASDQYSEDVFDIRSIAKALIIVGYENIDDIVRKGIDAGIITQDKIILPNET